MIGLTLAIGIFIDDAIVVIENIMKKMEAGMETFEATLLGVKEIAFTVLGISAMLLAVFIPIAFMDGIVGKFFNAFAATVASGVLISYLVAVMFIPAFGSRMLHHKESKFHAWTEPIFARLDRAYVFILKYLIRFKYLTIIGVVLLIAASAPIAKNVGMDFVPMEDNSEFQILIKADLGISLKEMRKRIQPLYEAVRENENVIDSILSIGYTDSKETHKAKIYAKLKPVEERTVGQADIVDSYRQKFSTIKDMVISVEEVPPFATGQSNAPIQIVITGDTLEELGKTSKAVMQYLHTIDGVVDIDSDYEEGKPQYEITILRENAKKQGVSSQQIGALLGAAFSSDRMISSFEDRGRQYDITLRFEDSKRRSIDDIKQLMILSNSGKLVPLEGMVEIKESSSLATINRFDRERKVMVTAYKTEETALDGIVKQLNTKLPELLPAGYSYRFTGEVERMEESNAAFAAALSLAAILIYLILAALYESLIQPLIIMVSMPLSFTGVIVALGLAGMNFSLFVMIGIILLMGMVGKNAVLVVDFANDAVKEGKKIDEALLEAGEKRLRPILMTTFAMVGAMMPLAFGGGAGHEGNAPMAMAVIGGLISSTILTLLVVPSIYKILYPMDAFLRKWYEKGKV